mgnify:FL=1
MKKKFLVLVLFILISASSFYFYNNAKNRNNIANKFIYNNQTNQWEQIKDEKDRLGPDRAQILEKNNNVDGLHNPTVLKGYFTKYDEVTQLLSVKSLLSFTQGLFENAELKLLPNQVIYCVPEIYTDPNNGKQIEIAKSNIPIKTGGKLWIPTEKIISFNEFIRQSNDRTFLFLQLTQDYNPQITNYVQKLIVVGICE